MTDMLYGSNTSKSSILDLTPKSLCNSKIETHSRSKTEDVFTMKNSPQEFRALELPPTETSRWEADDPSANVGTHVKELCIPQLNLPERPMYLSETPTTSEPANPTDS